MQLDRAATGGPEPALSEAEGFASIVGELTWVDGRAGGPAFRVSFRWGRSCTATLAHEPVLPVLDTETPAQ